LSILIKKKGTTPNESSPDVSGSSPALPGSASPEEAENKSSPEGVVAPKGVSPEDYEIIENSNSKTTAPTTSGGTSGSGSSPQIPQGGGVVSKFRRVPEVTEAQFALLTEEHGVDAVLRHLGYADISEKDRWEDFSEILEKGAASMEPER